MAYAEGSGTTTKSPVPVEKTSRWPFAVSVDVQTPPSPVNVRPAYSPVAFNPTAEKSPVFDEKPLNRSNVVWSA